MNFIFIEWKKKEEEKREDDDSNVAFIISTDSSVTSLA